MMMMKGDQVESYCLLKDTVNERALQKADQLVVKRVEAKVERVASWGKKSDGDDWLPGDYGTARIAQKGTEQFFSLQEVREACGPKRAHSRIYSPARARGAHPFSPSSLACCPA